MTNEIAPAQRANRKSAVVTGVSTGIGAGIVSQLINAGWQVFGSVRKEADASDAQMRYGVNFVPLIFDTTDEDAVSGAAKKVRAALGDRVLDGLVNNAGIALSDPLMVQSTEDFRQQIEVNLIGPFIVTKAFAPLLGATKDARGVKGRIVNISSVGGRISPPFLGAYAASKHGLEGMSGSLRRELQLFGVDVIVIGPGSVATPTWDKAEATRVSHLQGTVWEKPVRAFRDNIIKTGRQGLAPEAIGRVVVAALTARRPKVRYAPVVSKIADWLLPTRLPARLVDRLIGQQLGLLPQK